MNTENNSNLVNHNIEFLEDNSLSKGTLNITKNKNGRSVVAIEEKEWSFFCWLKNTVGYGWSDIRSQLIEAGHRPLDKKLREQSIQIINDNKLLSSLFTTKEKEVIKKDQSSYKLHWLSQQEKSDSTLHKNANNAIRFYRAVKYIPSLAIAYHKSRLINITNTFNNKEGDFNEAAVTNYLNHYYMYTAITPITYLANEKYEAKYHQIKRYMEEHPELKNLQAINCKAMSKGAHAAKMAFELKGKNSSDIKNRFHTLQDEFGNVNLTLLYLILKKATTSEYPPISATELDYLFFRIVYQSREKFDVLGTTRSSVSRRLNDFFGTLKETEEYQNVEKIDLDYLGKILREENQDENAIINLNHVKKLKEIIDEDLGKNYDKDVLRNPPEHPKFGQLYRDLEEIVRLAEKAAPRP